MRLGCKILLARKLTSFNRRNVCILVNKSLWFHPVGFNGEMIIQTGENLLRIFVSTEMYIIQMMSDSRYLCLNYFTDSQRTSITRIADITSMTSLAGVKSFAELFTIFSLYWHSGSYKTFYNTKYKDTRAKLDKIYWKS